MARIRARRRGNARHHRPRSAAHLQLESLEPRQLLAVVISEFMADNETTVADEDGAFEDWIEIRNTSGNPVSLDGWYLTDDAQDLNKWRFPAETIGGGEYILVFASSHDRSVAGSELHTNFKLSKDGEYLGLISSDAATIVDEYAPEYPEQAEDVSYGKSNDLATIGYFATPTPGAVNVGTPIADPSRAVVISEVMYHPSSENVLEEYIELHNRGTSAVNLAGWRFRNGVDFTFPNVTLAAGQYLAVAADVVTFNATYGAGVNVVGGWTGRLSNQGEAIELVDDVGVRIDKVDYADQGEWATRTPIVDLDEDGWSWEALHDGEGRSLELINLAMPNQYGQNWTSSVLNGGTPGAANSVNDANTAPFIQDVSHSPIIPRSSDTVTVTAHVTDEEATSNVRLFWRLDGAAGFGSIVMFDDGLGDDEAAGDGIYQATIPAQADGAIVEFYVRAGDGQNNLRTWPAPATSGAQSVNALYQVNNEFDPNFDWQPGSRPRFYQIMKQADQEVFLDNDNYNPLSDAQQHASFVVWDGTGVDVRHSVGIRVRGSASRNNQIKSNRINIPSDNPWHGVHQINVNAPAPVDQIAGSALFRLAGLPAADASAVQMYSNGEDLKDGGTYTYLEVPNSDFASNHFAGDSGGNLYRGRRRDESPPGSQDAGLEYLGPIAVPAPDPPDNQYASYFKLTNGSDADWSDIEQLTYLLNDCSVDGAFQQCGNDEYPAGYVETVAQVVDIDQWLRVLAVSALVDNNEFGILTGDSNGDDYMMYRGDEDPRFNMVIHDLDSLFARTNRGIDRYNGVPALRRLVNHPDILPRYFAQFRDLIDNVLLTDLANVTLDQVLQSVTSQGQIDSIKSFLADRAAFVLQQFPQTLTMDTGLPIVGDYLQTSDAALLIDGTTPAAQTRSVLVNGQPVTDLPGDGTWSLFSSLTGSTSGSGDVDLISRGESWSYLDDGSDQNTSWREVGFDATAWNSGPAELGYGDGDEVTLVGFGPDENNKYPTTYFRKIFNVPDPAAIESMRIFLKYDDAAAVYINGAEVIRTENLPPGAAFDDYATGDRNGENNYDEFVLPLAVISSLNQGQNTIAVEIHQGDGRSSDISFDLQLESTVNANELTLVNRGWDWRYLDDGSNQGIDWRNVGFDDSDWATGTAELGYGDGDEVTLVGFGPDENDKYPTTYFRSSFNVPADAEITGMSISLLYDDAAVVYINGVEAAITEGLTSNPSYDELSTTLATEGQYVDFGVPVSVLNALVAGENTIAVEVHQQAVDSSDISFDMELTADLAGSSGPINPTGVILNPGINRIFVEAFDGPDGLGNRIASEYVDVWYVGTDVVPTVNLPAVDVATMQLQVRDSYLPGTPLLVRVSAIDSDGNIEKNLWDSDALLMVDNPNVTLSTDRVALVNGQGSVLVTIEDDSDFTLTASYRGITTHKSIASVADETVLEVSGTLSGSMTNWSGVVRVTGDVTVPAGHMLNILPGTLVLLDGEAVGSTTSTKISVEGTLNSLGTPQRPVTFTASSANEVWGQIDLNGGDGTFRHTVITRAGNATRLGHTNSGAAIRMRGDANLEFHDGSITDLRGKSIYSTGGEANITDSMFARSAMGPEVERTGLQFHNNWIVDMAGVYHHSGVVDDNDSIYLHDQAAGQVLAVSGGVNAGADDDSIDLLGADVTITDYIIRDIFDKGVSQLRGEATIEKSLIVNADIGVNTKGTGNDRPHTVINDTTIANVNTGIRAEDKDAPDPDVVITFDVRDSIIWTYDGGDAVFTDYDPADIHITYSNVGEFWVGTGNISSDPLFSKVADKNFHPLPNSPSIDSGDPAKTDTDGTRADQGVFKNGFRGTYLTTQTIPGGNISADTILAPWNGPFHVTGELTVDDGARLVILPGTSVYFDQDVEVIVAGELTAAGSNYNRIRLTSDPNAPHIPDMPGLPDGPARWDGVHYVDSVSDNNRIMHTDVEFAQDSDGAIGVIDSRAFIDNITVAGTHIRMVYGENADMLLRNSVFPNMFAENESPDALDLDNISEHVKFIGGTPAGGRLVVQNNLFGTNKGHNDVIDMDSNRLPDPILQILDNVFLGAGDEHLDLGGDVYVAGNLFLNIFKDDETSDRGYANAISTGDAGSGTTIAVARNYFVDVDHAINLKRDTATIFENNTVYKVHGDFDDRFGNPNVGGAINLFVNEPNATPGDGAYVEANIFWDAPRIFSNPDMPDDTVSALEVHNNIVDPQIADNQIGSRPGTVLDLGVGNTVGGPRFVDAAALNLALDLGSAARGAGPVGQDIGANVSRGVFIAGEPATITSETSATLAVGGPGIFAYRYRVDGGPWSAELAIGNGFDPENGTLRTAQIDLASLSLGPHVVEVIGQDFAGVWQVEPTVSQRWIVAPGVASVRINEVLADNVSIDHEGATPDYIELYNDGTATVDLSGASLSDDLNDPRKFVFPTATTIAPGHYLTLYADDNNTSGLHTGFKLSSNGEAVYLYEPILAGGDLIDSIEFGVQLADLSLGRIGGDGQWTLNQPTPGAENIEQLTGNPRHLHINEWFANGEVRLTNDFVELHNADDLPVNIGGVHISDRPNPQPQQHQMTPYSYVAADGFIKLVADGDTAAGANHISFGLSSDREHLGLFDAQLHEIDRVMYFAQTRDITQGRVPDGGAGYEFSVLPTPGLANDQSSSNTVTVASIDWGDDWLYEDSGTDLGTAWRNQNFDDAAWLSGPGLLGVEAEPLPQPLQTELTIGSPTYYFRKHFDLGTSPNNVDVTFNTAIDDGAVVYVNGTEVQRVGMDPGPVTFDDFANRNVNEANIEGAFTIPSNLLVQGDNVIAVEAHQRNLASGDIVFGLQMEATQSITIGGDHATMIELLNDLRITELMYNPADGGSEYIELGNTGSVALDLTGVRLDGGVQFEFPAITLAAGEKVVVAENLTEFFAAYGSGVNVIGQYSGNLSDGGENLILRLPDPYEAAVLRFDYDDAWYSTTDGGGFALEIVSPLPHFRNWDQADSWQAGTIVGGTPGYDNTVPPGEGIVINEVLTHTDPPQTDAIELLNTTNHTVDISGWYLSDAAGNATKFQIPAGTVIQAGGTVVFDESAFNVSMGIDPNDFALNGAEGDQVVLWKTDASGSLVRIVDFVDFGAAANGESFGRVPDGTGPLAPMLELTLGCGNSHARVGPLLITEINYSPASPSAAAMAADPSVSANDLEFVEIYNPTGSSVSLADWRVRGGVDYDFSTTRVINAGQSLVLVSFDPTVVPRRNAFRAQYGIGAGVTLLGPYASQLNDGGERVVLQRPDLPPPNDPTFVPRLTEDEVRFDDTEPWANVSGNGSTLQRVGPAAFGSFANAWRGEAATPGSVSFTGGVFGDLTGDGQVNLADIGFMQYLVQTGNTDSFYDLDHSGTLDQDDLITLVEDAAGIRMGDADLDGNVDATDFNTWHSHNFQVVTCNGWSEGDFNGDDRIDVRDFNLWNDNRFLPAPADVPAESVHVPRAALAASLADELHWVTVADTQIDSVDSTVIPTFVAAPDGNDNRVGDRSQIQSSNHNSQQRDFWFATLERRGAQRDRVDTVTASRACGEKSDIFGNLTDWL